MVNDCCKTVAKKKTSMHRETSNAILQNIKPKPMNNNAKLMKHLMFHPTQKNNHIEKKNRPTLAEKQNKRLI